jgi:hypothetical protein
MFKRIYGVPTEFQVPYEIVAPVDLVSKVSVAKRHASFFISTRPRCALHARYVSVLTTTALAASMYSEPGCDMMLVGKQRR